MVHVIVLSFLCFQCKSVKASEIYLYKISSNGIKLLDRVANIGYHSFITYLMVEYGKKENRRTLVSSSQLNLLSFHLGV